MRFDRYGFKGVRLGLLICCVVVVACGSESESVYTGDRGALQNGETGAVEAGASGNPLVGDSPTRTLGMGDPHEFGGSIELKALPLPKAKKTIYVSSSSGNDSWTGGSAEANAAGTDGPLASIDAALASLNGASPGTHVLLRRGDTWNPIAALEIPDAVGTGSDPVVLGAYGSGAKPDIVALHANNVFTIRGSKRRASSHFRMNDLRIRSGQPVKGQVGVFVGEGYHPNSPHHITLSGLTIENCGGGVTLYGDEHLIHGSRIADNNFGHGVFLKGNKVRFSYNEFENNGLAPPDSFVHSLYMSDSQDVVFEYNEVHSATDGVKARRVDRAVFRNNIIHDVIKLGIHLGGDYSGGASGNRIESNLFYRNGADIVIKSESGTQVDAIDGLVIANNVVRARSPRGATGYGASVVLDAVPMREVWVVNNLLFGLGDVDGIRIRNTGEDVRCLNNIVTRSETSEAFAFETSVIEGGNLTFPHEAGLSPLHLAQTNAYDFSPTAASTLLIDQGVDVSPVLKFDFAGEPRLIGDQVDIGPFEFDPAESAAGIQP